MNRFARYKMIVIVFLLILIAGGGVMLFQQQPWSKKLLEITLTTPAPALSGEVEVYVGGAVVSPGWYPIEEGDSVGDVLSMAGGVTSDADPTRVELYIPESVESASPQKISINRAEAWLLDALPGIGPALAQNIIQYREQNGPFVMTEELLLVTGIGEAKYDGLKDLITVE